ncbi:MAG TPA: SRPBCC family protein [Acidimicrobiales bacterium]|nr:SRPBCC family protein [Acidimicrobiales bacterium]
MSADQFLTLDGRPTVRVERDYPHPIEKVWRAVTTPEHLGQWFPSPVEVDLRPGGEMRFSAFDGGPGAVGTVEAVDAPRRLTFTWGADRLTFELTSNGESTTFALIHTFDDRFGAPSFATGWDLCLVGLRSVLADEALPPPDRGIARHEELVHQFGLDRPEVTESEGRWTVRVERQLTCPVEVAWDLWFGKDRDTGEQRGAPAVGEPLTPYMAPEVVIGTMTEVELHRVLAFDVSPTGGPGEHVRVELADGTGHGARITLTVTGTEPDERDPAAETWGSGAVGHLAASAAEWAVAQPVVA